MRDLTVDCDLCGTRLPLERAKEAFFKTGNNAYHVMDLCPTCLDSQLQRATSVNDTDGMRQQAGALISLPGDEAPTHEAARRG